MNTDEIFRVYKVVRIATGDVKYIGITSQAVETRWAQHRSVARANRGSRMGAALRKYGEDAFEIIHIAHCENGVEAMRIERLLIADYGTFGRSGYNATPGGEGVGRDGRVISEEERKAITARNLEKWADPIWRAAQRERMRGCKKPTGFGEAISARRTGKPMSDETRAKMSASRIGKKHAPEVRARIAEQNRIRNASPEQRKATSDAWIARRSTSANSNQE